MKIAVLSESPADEAAIRILVEGLLDSNAEPPSIPLKKSRGWPGVRAILPKTLRDLHYTSDAEALVVVVDSDESPAHRPAHNQPDGADPKCRLCELRRRIATIQDKLRPRQGRGPIKVAVGLAVPAMEAWYLVGSGQRVDETTWTLGLDSGKLPYTKDWLKQQVYGTDRPSLELETKLAQEAAERIVRDGHLPKLEDLFPGGFGELAGSIRKW